MTFTGGTISARAALKLTLPKEHGSWSLALEPLALGLLVAPTTAGAWLALAAISGFFLRRPIKTFWREQDMARWQTAWFCTVILGFLAIGGLVMTGGLAGFGKLWALLPATLAGAVFAWCDSRNEAREGAAEIAGALAFGILPAAFGSLAGWSVSASLALTALMLVRSLSTVLTVRTFLRAGKGYAVSIWPALVSTTAGIVLMAWLSAFWLVPWSAVIFAVLFAARTGLLLLFRPKLTPRFIGFTELGLGVAMVVVTALNWPH